MLYTNDCHCLRLWTSWHQREVLSITLHHPLTSQTVKSMMHVHPTRTSKSWKLKPRYAQMVRITPPHVILNANPLPVDLILCVESRSTLILNTYASPIPHQKHLKSTPISTRNHPRQQTKPRHSLQANSANNKYCLKVKPSTQTLPLDTKQDATATPIPPSTQTFPLRQPPPQEPRLQVNQDAISIPSYHGC